MGQTERSVRFVYKLFLYPLKSACSELRFMGIVLDMEIKIYIHGAPIPFLMT